MLQALFQQIHCRFPAFFCNMSVGVQRDADVRMPHEHLQIFEVGAAGDHVRSIGVSQSMHVEGDRFQVRLDELVAVLQGLRRDQLSVRFSADEADRNQLLTGICFCQEFTAADSAADHTVICSEIRVDDIVLSALDVFHRTVMRMIVIILRTLIFLVV